MTEYRVRITNLPKEVGREPGKISFVIIGANSDGVTLCAATIDDFPTEFNDQMGQEGKQLNVIESIEQDPEDPAFVLCKVSDVWVPVDERGEFNVSANDEQTKIIDLNKLPGAEGETHA